MRKDRELDEILESIKSRKADEQAPVLIPKSEPEEVLAPPVVNTDELVWIDNNDIKQKLNNTQNVVDEPLIDLPAPQRKTAPTVEEAVEAAEEEPQQPKTVSNKAFVKLVAVTVAVLLAVASIVIAVIYFTKGEEQPQEVEKYSYSQDVLKEYKNAYQKTNQIAGSISIEDLDVEKYFTAEKYLNYPYLYNGADIAVEQQIISIDVSNLDIDLESLYATSDDYINSSQYIEFNTLFEKGSYKVVAAYYINKLPNDNNDYVFPYNLCGTMTKDSFSTYRSKIKSRQLYDTGYDILYTDKLLSICADSNTLDNNYKFVVLCVKTDDISKTTQVVDNNDTYYPQSYYDKLGIDNPYKFAVGWYPEMIVDQSTGETQTLTMNDVLEKSN